MIEQPDMLLLGSAGKNAGKTELACRIIRKFGHLNDIVGIKITTIQGKDEQFHRGNNSYGFPPDFKGNFCIIEQRNGHSGKDTARMLDAGAKEVFWLQAVKDHLNDGFNALTDIIVNNTISVCESNSLRLVVEPGLFLVVKKKDSPLLKPSCRDVIGYADRIVVSDEPYFDIDLNRIMLIDGKWVMRRPATAVLMAGGKSNRMGHDKSMLPVNGKPMIEHILEQIKPCFDEVLISSDDLEKFSFLNADVVPDKVPDQGPLMGILSSLEASSHDINFVVACDVPIINYAFMGRMFRLVDGYDGVIPITEDSKYEPLFGIYRKSMIAPIQEIISAGGRKISDVFSKCKINFIDIADAEWYKNLNTIVEYKKLSGTSNHTWKR